MIPTLDDDVTAGPGSFQGFVRVSDGRWGAMDPVAIADMALTALTGACSLSVSPASCDVLFADDETLRELNARYRSKDRPTNVLAFPSGEEAERGEPLFLGGIALSFDRARDEASDRGIPMTDHVTHLTLHGMLHLLGFDHEDEDERLEMERIEVNLLAGLGIADPYGGS